MPCTLQLSPHVAARGPVWRSPAASVAARGLALPRVAPRWLPTWLPQLVSAANVQRFPPPMPWVPIPPPGLEQLARPATVPANAQSGSRDALPRPCPLRTVRATRRGTRLKQAARASRVEVLPRHLEDPLPQPPCVLLMGTPVNGVPLQHVLRSVHRHRRLTCPLVPAVTICSSSPAQLPTSARFRARAPGPVSGQLCHAPGGAPGKTARVSCCLP